jgi:hypothetical protein
MFKGFAENFAVVATGFTALVVVTCADAAVTAVIRPARLEVPLGETSIQEGVCWV